MQGMIVVVNAGSSSIKFALFSAAGRPSRASLLSQGGLSGIGQTVRFRASDTAGAVIADQTLDATTTHEGAVDVLLGWLDQNYPDSPLLAAGHRVVHGGMHYCAPVVIDAAVIESYGSSFRLPRCTSRITLLPSKRCFDATPVCCRSPALIPPSTMARRTWSHTLRCRAPLPRTASVAMASTVCPTNTSPV